MTWAISDRRPMLRVVLMSDRLRGASARGQTAASLTSARPRPRRNEQRLGMEVRKPDRWQIREALDADVAAPPLREELPVERVETLELEDVVGEQNAAAHDPLGRRRHPVGSDEVRERAEVEGQLARARLARPGERLDDEKLGQAVRRVRAAPH